MPSLWISNLIAYWAQVTLFVAAGAVLAFALRLRTPRVRLAFWQMLLAACLLLPGLQHWQRPPETPSPMTAGAMGGFNVVRPPTRPMLPPLPVIALWTLALGMAGRAAWLALGLLRLRRYRRRAELLALPPPPVAEMQDLLQVWPQIYRCPSTPGPVTFGLRDPAVLFPAPFFEQDSQIQAAIACHELLHVRRRDWAFTVLEELVRTVLWFHPAIWWLLGQIQLAREQVVDREVVRLTAARDRYLEALLAMASAQAQPDLAPAPLFLRKRHLARRVASILREVSMSRRHVFAALVSAAATLLLVARFAVWTFPLTSAAQEPPRQPALAESGGMKLLHSRPPRYPKEALEKRIEGAVVLEVDIAASGKVEDARVLSGPMELRAAALESVLQWHYATEAPLPAKAQVTVAFKLPEQAPGRAYTGQMALPPPNLTPGILKEISVRGVTPEVAREITSRLPIHEGDTVTPEVMERVRNVIAEIDEHLRFGFGRSPDGTATLRIFLVDSPPPPPPAASLADTTDLPPPEPGTRRIRVGGTVAQKNRVSAAQPTYPPLAKQARIQGTVLLSVLIARDGTIKHIGVVSGHPLLIPAAIEAVKQWVYRPTLLNGDPVEVITDVDVNFTLSQ